MLCFSWAAFQTRAARTLFAPHQVYTLNLTKNQLENELEMRQFWGAAFPAAAPQPSITQCCPPSGPGHLCGHVPTSWVPLSRFGCHLEMLFFISSPMAGWEENPVHGAQHCGDGLLW